MLANSELDMDVERHDVGNSRVEVSPREGGDGRTFGGVAAGC